MLKKPPPVIACPMVWRIKGLPLVGQLAELCPSLLQRTQMGSKVHSDWK
jgi:hypothetical protein